MGIQNIENIFMGNSKYRKYRKYIYGEFKI